jgi:hypothetical protein
MNSIANNLYILCFIIHQPQVILITLFMMGQYHVLKISDIDVTCYGYIEIY